MLDVYRKVYGFTGEPFRLGPDHRFSLHHASYANAKAYLEYAIFQGEGFVTITGGPGTGKTTLISEILTVVDDEKIEVSTLTSTQLESRDLLYMVARSFGMQADDAGKANLLLDIESFLVKKVRAGQRAILIVDEAQGLSAGAIEELRLLANLQYKYQLLLQIILVGQEQLLELIQQPAMEHLRQRLVAATSLDPLSFDETIDYIEHRLSRVAWKGDPAIDEEALSLVYAHSGGIPRRINLIMNRLFLYGGMDDKHQYALGDVEDVLKGLVDEFLIPPEPLVDVGGIPESGPGCIRHLPRESADASKPEQNEEQAGAGTDSVDVQAAVSVAGSAVEAVAAQPAPASDPDVPTEVAPAPDRVSGKARILSPRTTDGRKPVAKPVPADMDVGSARRPPRTAGPTAVAENSTVADKQTRHRPPASTEAPVPEENKSKDKDKSRGGKGLLMVLVLLASAGSAWLWREEPVSTDSQENILKPEASMQGDTLISRANEQEPRAIDSIAIVQPEVLEVEATDSTLAVEAPIEQAVSPVEEVTADPEVAEENVVEQDAVEQPAGDVPVVEKEPTEAKASEADVAPIDTVALATAEPEPEPVVSSIAAEKSVSDPQGVSETRAAVVDPEPADQKAERVVAPASTPAAPSDAVVETRRRQLREAAEKRLKERELQLASLRPQAATTAPARTAPAAAIVAPVAAERNKPGDGAAPSKKKVPSVTAADVKQSLLRGRWSSAGKPASLLPSATTQCRDQFGLVSCNSVPQNVKTQYGLALYKVETELSGFSREGHFELAYRTLVRLVDDSANKTADPNAGWQITEYAMSCTLNSPNQVSCLDGKGISRKYQRDAP